MRHGRVREDSFMIKNIVCIAALAVASGSTLASSYDAFRSGFDGGGGITVNGTSYSGGLIQYTYGAGGSPAGMAAGQFVGNAGDTFVSFCIELEQFASTSMRTYTIVDLASAPDPTNTGVNNPNPNAPNSYGPGIAQRIHEVVARAIVRQWINSDLSLGSLGDTQTNRVVQAAIWDAIFGGTTLTGNATIQANFNDLVSQYGSGARVAGLRAAVSPNAQDHLYIVPLPPAAFAGLATLVGVAGVARLRRR